MRIPQIFTLIRGIQHAGIVLRHLDVGVTKHLGHVLDAHAIGEAHRGGVAMSRRMCCQVLLDHAKVGDFFQIAVHLLVAGDGEQDFLL